MPYQSVSPDIAETQRRINTGWRLRLLPDGTWALLNNLQSAVARGFWGLPSSKARMHYLALTRPSIHTALAGL